MILSHRWLRRHLPDLPSPADVVTGLEQIGVEVASKSRWGENFSRVELVEVVSRRPHPDSDHLSLVDVRRGSGEITQIVTGASNGFPGERLWYAPPGTTLPDGRTLEVRALRGIESPGMLLSSEELGYAAPTGDLWVWSGEEPLGTSFLTVIGGADTLYELELTPNIAQYLQSVRHLARELGAIWGMTLAPQVTPFAYENDVLARVDAPERCPLYGLVAMKIKPHQSSPLWLQTLLRAVGHRIIHPAVDITNFVLWDLGEPLHAFDAKKVEGPIEVRLAEPGERLTLLDGRALALNGDDLVIADGTKPLALAGIMGGIDSGVSADTENILLECAHFSAPGIFRSFKQHGLMTDAAQHFGRGTDPWAVFDAPSLVAQVLEDAGIFESVTSSTLQGELPPERRVDADLARIRSLLGVDWSDEKLIHALEGFGYEREGKELMVPRYRHDVETVYDLAEDVARFYGLDAMPSTLPEGRMALAKTTPRVAFDEEIRDLTASAGYQEVITRTLVSPEWEKLSWETNGTPVRVANPLREDESELRRHILGSLLEVVRYNRARHQKPIRIFELGSVFRREGGQVHEGRELGVVLTLEPEETYPHRETPSLYDLTGLVDFLFERLGIPDGARVDTADVPRFLHPGQCQRLVIGGQPVGWVGELRPRLALEYRVRRMAVLVMRIDPMPVRRISHPGRPSKFPEVERDLSLVIPDHVSYRAVLETLSGLAIDALADVRPIDKFQGDFGTSLTIRLRFQSHQETLTDAMVDTETGRILAELGTIGVELRQ